MGKAALRSSIAGIALVGVAVAASPSATADSATAKWTEALLESVTHGEPGLAVELCSDEVREKLAADPVSLYRACRVCYRNVATMARREMDKTDQLALWLYDTASAGCAPKEGAAKNPIAMRALATATALEARVGAEHAPPTGLSEWRKACDLAVASYDAGTPDDGEAYALAAGWLRDGSTVTGADRNAFLAASDALAQKAAAAFPGSVHAALARAQTCLARAEAVIKTSPGDAKAAIDTCVQVLQPLVAKDPPDRAVGTLHTQAITFAKLNKLPVKGDYRMVKGAGLTLVANTPLSEGWRDSGGDDILGLAQYDPSGKLLREFTARTYSWDTNYRDDEGVAGGDNVKGLARQDQKVRKRDYASITGTKDLQKVPLNKNIPGAEGYEIAGTTDKGEFRRERVWYFKSKSSMVTYELVVIEHVDVARLDPEAQAVIDSIVEHKGK